MLSSFAVVWPLASLAGDGNVLISAVEKTEKRLNARMGFSMYDSETGQRWAYHADRAFPLTSTFKTLACAALLHRVDTGEEDLERIVTFEVDDLVTYSPVTEQHVGPEGMSLSDLCRATMETSDNSAANQILKAIGGPGAVTAFARSLGDEVTRLDRWETDLNEAVPGDKRDTTTPNAMVENLTTLILGDALSTGSRQQLRGWLESNQVAETLFRASVPDDWIVADRTGAGGYGSRSITAVMWPPDRKPVVVALYLTQTEASLDERNAAFAEIGAMIARVIAGRSRVH